MSGPLLGFVVVIALFNVFASVRILGSRRFSGAQKAAQIAVVWLLPAVGAVVCMVMTTSLDRREGSGEDGVAISAPDIVDGGIWSAGSHGSVSCDGGGDFADGGGGDGGGGGD